jgi:hypothetical protein
LDDKRRKGFFWWKVAVFSGIALLSGFMTLYWLMGNFKLGQEKVTSGNQPQSGSIKKQIPEKESAKTDLQSAKNTDPKKVKTHPPYKNKETHQPENYGSGAGSEFVKKQNVTGKEIALTNETILNEGSIPKLFNIEPFGIRLVFFRLENNIPENLKGFEPKEPKNPLGRWILGIGVAQNRSGMSYSINPQNEKYVHKNYVKRMKEGEFVAGNVQANLSVGFKLNSKWALFTGLSYSSQNNRQNFSFTDEVPVTLMPGNKPDKFGNYPIIGYFTPSTPSYTSYSGFSKLSFVEIPLGLMFEQKINEKWTLISTASFNSCRITEETGYTLDYQLLSAIPRQHEWFRKTVYSAGATMGIYKNISRSVCWGANFNTNRNITPVYIQDASIRPRTWTAGLGMQLLWRIDR